MPYAIKQVYRPSPGARLKIRFVDTSNGQIINNLTGYTVLEQGAFNFGRTATENSQSTSDSSTLTTSNQNLSRDIESSRNDGFDRGSEYLSKEGPVPGITDLRKDDSIANSIERTPENNFGWVDASLNLTDFVPGLNVITGLVERVNNMAALDAMYEYYGLSKLSGIERIQAMIQPGNFARIGPFTDKNGNKYHIDPRSNITDTQGLNIAKPQNMTRDKLIDVPLAMDGTEEQALNQTPSKQTQALQQVYENIFDDPRFIQKLADDPNAASLLQAMGYQYEKPGSVPPGGFVNPYVGTQEALAINSKINEVADQHRQSQTAGLGQGGTAQGMASPFSQYFGGAQKGSQIAATPASNTVLDVILGEALAGDYDDMKAVASAIQNRSNELRVPPDDVVSVQRQVGSKTYKEFDAFGKPLPEGVNKFRDLAVQAWNDVQVNGPVHNGSFYATPAAMNKLPSGLKEVHRTNGHVYFEDPQGRAIYTAKGLITPEKVQDFKKTGLELSPEARPSLAPYANDKVAGRPSTDINEDLGGLGFAAPGQPGVQTDKMGIPISRSVGAPAGTPGNMGAAGYGLGVPAQSGTGFATDKPINPFSNFDAAGRYTGNAVNPNAGFMDMRGYVNASPRNADPLAGMEPRMERSFLYDNMGTSPFGPGQSKNITDQNVPLGFIQGVINGYNAIKDMSNDPMGGQFINSMRNPENQQARSRPDFNWELTDMAPRYDQMIEGKREKQYQQLDKELQEIINDLGNKYGKDQTRSYFSDLISGMAGTSRSFSRNDDPFGYMFSSSSTDRVSGLSQGGFLSPSAPSGPANTGSPTSSWSGADAPSSPGGYQGDFGGGPQSTGGDRPGGSYSTGFEGSPEANPGSRSNDYGDWGGWASGFDVYGGP